MNSNHKKWIVIILASWVGMLDALSANCTANSPVPCGGGSSVAVKFCKLEWAVVKVMIQGKNVPVPIPIPEVDVCNYEETAGSFDSCTAGTVLNNKCGNPQTVKCTAKRKNTGPCCGVDPGNWVWDAKYDVKVTLWTGTACEPRSGEK
jgi:hypothetical protein